MPQRLAVNRRRFLGSLWNGRAPEAELLGHMTLLVDTGQLNLVIDHLSPLELVALALEQVGLALLATLAAVCTAQTGSLASGYDFSFLVALGLDLLAIVLVATQLNHQVCQAELVGQRQQAVQVTADAPLPQELKKP